MTAQNPSPPEFYNVKEHHKNLLGHISIGVKSYDVAKTFWAAIMAPLGIEVTYDDPKDRFLGLGHAADGSEIINIFERGAAAALPGPGVHWCFNAPSRRCVREWWQAGVGSGGRDNGGPGVRGEETGTGEVLGNYYAAYLIDPDGYRLEAVYQQKDGAERDRLEEGEGEGD
ncbi:MAG: hypothetical protein MMC33_009739 [Icmadophila ericetorum]|nr:hypothetical protein [Icmadophila ericetorum]